MTSSPVVTALTVPIAPEDSAVIDSLAANCFAVPEVYTNCIGEVVVIILAVAPLVAPVIFSPLVNVPVTSLSDIVGATASVSEAADSNTAINLNTSARPKEICLSVGLVPNASVAPGTTLTCFINLVVLVFWTTDVLEMVVIIFNFAPVPNTEELVIETVPVPPPENPVAALTISPALPEPVPAVKIEIV